MSAKNPIVALMSKIFGFIWKLLERLVKSIQVLFFLVFIVILFAALSNLTGSNITVPDGAALVIAPAGMLVEQPEGEPLDRALLQVGEDDSQTVVSDVVESLRYAAEDDRIAMVVLLPGYMQGGGLSKQQALGDALDEFRESGKQVVAMADAYDQSQYYLASHADEIYLHDFGFVLIEGFGYFRAYFADAIEKLKVDVNVFRVGEYKSFVEPYLRNDMSEEDKVAARRWLNGLWEIYRKDVLAARDLDEQVFDEYVNDLVAVLRAADGDAARAAVDMGLVDGLMNHQQFRAYISEQVGVSDDEPDTFAQIDYLSYLTAMGLENGDAEEPATYVAVIVASGEIVDGEASPGVIGSVSLNQLIRQAANDDSIAAVVLQIDSPGGSMFASEVILDQLDDLQERGKPLVASMSSVAASGGYYIAMGADEIWAAESTISGSIGVGAMFPTFQRSLAALGVTIDGFGTTELAGQLTATQALGDTGRELLDLSVNSAYDVFINKVAEARSMDAEQVDGIAQGRVWIGGDAAEIGLIDNIGGLDDAIASAADLAGLAEDDYGVVYIVRELSMGEQLLLSYARLLGITLGLFDSGSGIGHLAERALGPLQRELSLLEVWNDPRGIYYHCFCEIQ
jgi:protease-4